MTTPVPDADAAEQQRGAAGEELPEAAAEPTEVGDDVPAADAAEQARPAGPGTGADVRPERRLEADDADAAEQALDVPLDEDEGRE